LIEWFFVKIAGLFRVRVMVHGWDTECICGSTIVHDNDHLTRVLVSMDQFRARQDAEGGGEGDDAGFLGKEGLLPPSSIARIFALLWREISASSISISSLGVGNGGKGSAGALVLFGVSRRRVGFVDIRVGGRRTGYSWSTERVGLEAGIELIVIDVGRVCDLGRGG
jgi:hypothetical protein